MLRTVIVALSVASIAGPAVGQSGWGMSTGPGWHPRTFGSLGSSGWESCVNDNHEYSLERAVRDCTRIVDDPHADRLSQADALWFRAKVYFDLQQDELARADLHRARELYTEAIQANPREPGGYNNHASVNMRLENYDIALADYDRAIEFEGDYATPHVGRAQILFRRGDYAGKCATRAATQTDLDAARRFCDRAVRNSQNSAWALTTRGYFHVMRGDLDAAARDFARAVERDAYYAPALYGRGAVAVRQGRQAEGDADMARALEMNRWQVEYFANAGLRP
jgi:tetratricopeptide (TPR) repeat protein